jgi:hypothetical protein
MYQINTVFELERSQFESYCWIAGGAVLSHLTQAPIKDLDIFFSTESNRQNAVDGLIRKGGTHVKKLRLGDSIEFEDKVYDLLHMGATPQETIECFDYTVCSIAVDLLGKTYKHPDFDEHLEKRKLVYTGGNDEWFSDISKTVNLNVLKARRMARYLKKGFDIDDENIKNIFKT